MLSRESAPKYGVSQGALTISRAPDTAQALIGKTLLEAGAISVAGTYECEIATDGMAAIEVEIMCSAVTGTIAPALRAMRGDRESFAAANVDTAANMAAGVAEVITLTSLLGRQVCKVVFVVGAGESMTFAKGTTLGTPTAIAEWNGI